MTSGREQKELTGVSLLGNKTKYPTDYAPEVLEAFINKHPGNDYFVKFNCPEFTSQCPMTGQPDFAATSHGVDPGTRAGGRQCGLHDCCPGPENGSAYSRDAQPHRR